MPRPHDEIQRELEWLKGAFDQTTWDRIFLLSQIIQGCFDIYGTSRLKGEDIQSQVNTQTSPGTSPLSAVLGAPAAGDVRYWLHLHATVGGAGSAEPVRLEVTEGTVFVCVVSNDALDSGGKEAISANGLYCADGFYPSATFETPQINETLTIAGFYLDLPRGVCAGFTPPSISHP